MAFTANIILLNRIIAFSERGLDISVHILLYCLSFVLDFDYCFDKVSNHVEMETVVHFKDIRNRKVYLVLLLQVQTSTSDIQATIQGLLDFDGNKVVIVSDVDIEKVLEITSTTEKGNVNPIAKVENGMNFGVNYSNYTLTGITKTKLIMTNNDTDFRQKDDLMAFLTRYFMNFCHAIDGYEKLI